MTETTERVPRDELHRLLVMATPTGAIEPLRRHPRPESQIAAMLPAIPPVRSPRVRAPTLVGVSSVVVSPVVAEAPAPIVVEVPALPAIQVVAMAPAVVAASVPPYRFALAAVFYALVLFALLAVF